ncbi:MAG: hypothetical protein ABI903_17320 [Actinomycetota bacterium]
MSPADPATFSTAPTRTGLAGDSLRTPEHREETSKPDDGATRRTLTMSPWPRQPVSLARVGLSRNAHPRPFNDPSNYLG